MCLLCESAVTAKERRNLHSESTEHVLPILLELSGALETPATETVFILKLITRSWFGRSIANSQLSLTLFSRLKSTDCHVTNT